MSVRIVVSDTFGRQILQVSKFDSVKWTATYNKAGWFRITFTPKNYPRGLFQADRRVEIYRKPRGRAEHLAFLGYMRAYDEDNEQYSYTEDYSDEWTVVYYGGTGQEAARIFGVGATNADRLRKSAINRREGFHQDTNESDVTILSDGAEGKLYKNRPFIDFQPTNIELTQVYQADWGLGDTLRINSGNPNTISVSGPDMTELLGRRIVAYRAGTSEASKNTFADDMMKEYVDENLVNATDTDRNLDAGLNFEIADDQSAGPTVTYSAKFGNLLNVLKRVSDEAAEAGTRVYFRVIPVLRDGVYVPRFETRIGRWGQDRTYLKIGQGERVSDLSVIGVQVTATRDSEKVIPLFEDINDA
jgi:hypothetical protein